MVWKAIARSLEVVETHHKIGGKECTLIRSFVFGRDWEQLQPELPFSTNTDARLVFARTNKNFKATLVALVPVVRSWYLRRR